MELQSPIPKEPASVHHTWWYPGLGPIGGGNRKRELCRKGPPETPVTGQELEASEECQSKSRSDLGNYFHRFLHINWTRTMKV